MANNDGGPAFPAPGLIGKVDEHGNAEPTFVNWQGMTLRDYFAAKALNGVMQDFDNIKNFSHQASEEKTLATVLTEQCYKVADAMLKERAK